MIRGRIEQGESEYILIAKNIKMHFKIKEPFPARSKLTLKAIDGVDMFIRRGEVAGLVGESGCGKTTLGKVLIGLLEPTNGYVLFNPPYDVATKLASNQEMSDSQLKIISLHNSNRKKRREYRKEVQIVFQDPYSSLDPRYLVKDIICEGLFSFGIKREEAYKIAAKLLSEVGLSDEFMNRFPHQLSGGQRQRVAIARALAQNPKFVVLDEPTSALDVSVQAQVLNLLRHLKEAYNLTMLFISHNLLVVRYLCDRIFVMYLGKIVEIARTEVLFNNPLHPYSAALISAVPIPDPDTRRERIILEGEVPSPIYPPRGCRFHTRCRFAFEKCGWSSSEVAEGVAFAIDPTRNETLVNFPKVASVDVMDPQTVEIKFREELSNDQFETIKDIIDQEKSKGQIRSLFGIQGVKKSEKGVEISLFRDIVEPPLIKAEEEHYVACWLVESI
ncbi:MAG: ABC transporter ATP-binding protein [Thermoplasmatales archaeon]